VSVAASSRTERKKKDLENAAFLAADHGSTSTLSLVTYTGSNAEVATGTFLLDISGCITQCPEILAQSRVVDEHSLPHQFKEHCCGVAVTRFQKTSKHSGIGLALGFDEQQSVVAIAQEAANVGLFLRRSRAPRETPVRLYIHARQLR